MSSVALGASSNLCERFSVDARGPLNAKVERALVKRHTGCKRHTIIPVLTKGRCHRSDISRQMYTHVKTGMHLNVQINLHKFKYRGSIQTLQYTAAHNYVSYTDFLNRSQHLYETPSSFSANLRGHTYFYF